VSLFYVSPTAEKARRPLTMYFGPHTVLLTLEIQFDPTIAAGDIEGVIDRIEKKIRNRFPDIKHILIAAESITALERNASAR
jgi:divalent metal cation (Fe/Co/Zn/Cd) transporter